MGKRSNFERIERDFYPTPYEAVHPLFKHIEEYSTFYEPCVGDGSLIKHLLTGCVVCRGSSDIEDLYKGNHRDALTITENDVKSCDYIITNPPWNRKILHPMIDHFRLLKSTWLLFDSDWPHTKQSIPYMKYCSKIVAVGRIKWIPNSTYAGKDNCCWYLFDKEEKETIFYGR